MHPNALVGLAADLLRAVLKLDAPADGVVTQFVRGHRSLGSRERRALTETAYAVLRRRRLFEHLARVDARPPASEGGSFERRLAALGWAGDADSLQAALSPPEQAWLAAVRQIEPATLAPALRHNLPDWLASALEAAVGAAEFDALARALLEPAPLDLRVNLMKAKRQEVRASLQAGGIESVDCAHSPWGLRVSGKPALQALASFERGEFEVQDEGSQLLALLADAGRGQMVVDFCAGAGGKTLALGASMRNTGRLYAFDVSGHRLQALKTRLERSGLTNVHPTQIAHERDERVGRLAGKCDRVLVDTPCSGLGTLRRNPDLKWRQTPATIAEASVRQRAILEGAACLPKAGGRLVYATCSLLDAENAQIARAFGCDHPEFRPVDVAVLLQARKVDTADALVVDGCLSLWPHRHQTDGFFAAVWERR